MFGKLSMVAVVVVLVAGGAVVQASPITGTFLGPEMLDGRWSESYIAGAQSLPSNQLHAGSWDGTVLAGQWELTGATLLSDTPSLPQIIPTPFGNVTATRFFTVYTGGQITLKDGPWTGGTDGDYVVNLTSFTQNVTVYTMGGVPIGTTGDVTLTGTVSGWDGFEMSYLAASTTIEGSGTAAAAILAGYPSLSAAMGQWGGITGTQMSITPEPATMGLLGLGALCMFIRRRRK